MSTFGQLIDDTLMQLSGFSAGQDQSTPLTVFLGPEDTTVTVSDVTQLSRGMAEIDREIIYIESVDPGSSTATITRGYRSSGSSSHPVGSRVTMSPLFFRRFVASAIAETISSVYPLLYAVGTATFTANGSQNTFELPAGAESILDIKWQTVGPTQEWVPIRRWSSDGNANTGAFASGVSVSIFDPVPSGRTIQVVYAKQPETFEDDEDLTFSNTGLPASCEDVIRLGACWRLVTFLDVPHFAGLTAEADFAANNRQAGAVVGMARFLMQQFQVRLNEEAGRLNSQYPPRVHFTN